MSKKKEKIDLNNLAPEEELKYEIAKELGLLDKVMEQGWKALTAKETGRIGGLMTRRRREEKEVRYVTADKICFRCHDKRKETI